LRLRVLESRAVGSHPPDVRRAAAALLDVREI
jgi:hypothetical protein